MNAALYDVSRFAVWMATRALWGMRGEGVENIPREGPVILASNHASFLDPLLLGVLCPRRVCYLARSSLGRVPLLGRWMRGVGTVFVDPKASVGSSMHALVGVLAAGGTVAVFPEGTRTSDGRLRPFKRGVHVLLKKTTAVVVPAGIRGSFECFPRGRRLPGLFRRCSVVYGRPMQQEEVLAEGGLEELRRRVAALSGQQLAGSGPEGAPPTHPGPCSEQVVSASPRPRAEESPSPASREGTRPSGEA